MPVFGRSYQAFIAVEGLYILLLFISAARWLKVDRNRVRRALLGALGAAVANVGLDVVAHHFGWWRYPEATTPFGPLVYYVEAGLGFGLLALVGWRLHERFAARGLVGMIVPMCIYGAARDHLTDHLIGLIEFRPGAGIVFADALLEWVLPFLVALAITGRASTAPARSRPDDLASREA